jgi:hypothetical protein
VGERELRRRVFYGAENKESWRGMGDWDWEATAATNFSLLGLGRKERLIY